MLLDHPEHYQVLYDASRQQGITHEIRTAALDAAGDPGTVLQQLRSREDLQVALAQAPGYTPTPLIAVDQLLYSLTLLAGPADEELDAALPPEGVDELFRSQRVRDWLHGLGQLAPGE